MRSFFKIFLFICFSAYVLIPLPILAGEIIYGRDIKQEASKYFSSIGLDAKILISDRRAFYFCSSDLIFVPRIDGDWRTVEAKCESENSRSILRTTSLPPNEITSNPSYIGSTLKAVSLSNNMSKGQVISKNDLIFVELPKRDVFESFTNFDSLIGKKITRNLAKGTVLKARHVQYTMSVNKNDTVLIVYGNKKLSITTYGLALASGQNGDMITVENLKSKKSFKAIIIDEKKVTPLANM